MKDFLFVGFACFWAILGLSGCVKDPNSDTTATSTAYNPTPVDTPYNGQTINNTNYQQTMQNQTARAQQFIDSHPRGGGRR